MRLFVALEVPEPQRLEVTRRRRVLEGALPPASWVRQENLHLTLVFLGEVNDRERSRLDQVLPEAFAAFPPQPLALAGGGTFPPSRPARVAWVGLEHGPRLPAMRERVRALAQEAAARPLDDRPFHPHLTVARCRRPWGRSAAESFAAGFAGPVGEPFVAAEGLLLASRLGPGGPRYRVEGRFALTGSAGEVPAVPAGLSRGEGP